MQTQLSTDRKNRQNKTKQKKTSAQISHCMKLTQTTGPTLTKGETKRKKELNLEAWEKETSNTIS